MVPIAGGHCAFIILAIFRKLTMSVCSEVGACAARSERVQRGRSVCGEVGECAARLGACAAEMSVCSEVLN